MNYNTALRWNISFLNKFMLQVKKLVRKVKKVTKNIGMNKEVKNSCCQSFGLDNKVKEG